MTPQHSSEQRIGDVVGAAIGWTAAKRAVARASTWHMEHAERLTRAQRRQADAELELAGRQYVAACERLEAAVDALDVVLYDVPLSPETPAGGHAVPPAGENNGRRS